MKIDTYIETSKPDCDPYSWPDIFTGKKTVQERWNEGKTEAHSKGLLCADGLVAWGNCSMGYKMPASFGTVMAEIGRRLGTEATAQGLSAFGTQVMPKLL